MVCEKIYEILTSYDTRKLLKVINGDYENNRSKITVIKPFLLKDLYIRSRRK